MESKLFQGVMIRTMKKILIVLLSIFLVLPGTFPVAAASSNEEKVDNAGQVVGKDEVVYATLSPDGIGKELYIVNSLEVSEGGQVVDYGKYSSVKNLTDLTEIT